MDVQVHNGGSVFQFEIKSAAARTWVDENVGSEGWQWMGNRLCVEHRFAGPLAEGLIEAGFDVH